jgi:D-alanine--poly(phosphoribitol) ligase subunit 1
VTPYPHNVPDIFRGLVQSNPDRPALAWPEGNVVTFRELNRLSDRAAHFLREHGVRKGDRVCIRMDKSTLAYSLILACLKIGAPYFVVDPSNPPSRVEHILRKCLPKLIFSANGSPLDTGDYRTVAVDPNEPLTLLDGMTGEAFESGTDILGSDPAYIMFTSGSTGFPKGAVMSHANLLSFVQWAKQEFSVTAADVFTGVNPLFFDNSVFDFYAAVMNGASLVPFNSVSMKDPYLVLRQIDKSHCTIYFSVPSLLIYFQTLRLMSPSVFASIRTVIFGGEGYPKPKLKELFEAVGDRMEFVNVYGPTECTCICSAYRITNSDFQGLEGYAPLGEPVKNFSFVILTEQDQAAEPGEVGELHLGGPCVGLGYFNDPELTRKAFRQNPLNVFFDERLYRTGDLVRRSPEDGKVHFVGRRDSQIKHQGYRIELGEIEHALGRVGGVDEAVALHSIANGISRIIGVVATRSVLSAEAIRKEVANMVPSYMVPGRIDVLDRLPKNDNGKIDRRLLQTRYSGTP